MKRKIRVKAIHMIDTWHALVIVAFLLVSALLLSACSSPQPAVEAKPAAEVPEAPAEAAIEEPPAVQPEAPAAQTTQMDVPVYPGAQLVIDKSFAGGGLWEFYTTGASVQEVADFYDAQLQGNLEWDSAGDGFQFRTELSQITGKERPTSDQLAQYGRLFSVSAAVNKDHGYIEAHTLTFSNLHDQLPENQTIILLTIITYDEA